MRAPLAFALAAGFGLFAALALAGGPVVPVETKRHPYHFLGQVTFDKQTVENGDPRGSIDYAFGPLAAGNANCADSPPVTLAPLGAVLGDPCVVGTNVGMGMSYLDGGANPDGGAYLWVETTLTAAIPSVQVSLSCNVTDNNVARVRACAAKADGGAVSLPDSGYWVRIFSK